MTTSPFVPDAEETIAMRFVWVLLLARASRRIPTLVLLAMSLLSYCPIASAMDPHQRIDHLYHTSWNQTQGITAVVTSLAQTTDGYLWLGTLDGLLRFNGISFERYRPENGPLMGNVVNTLLSVPDGGLWIGFGSGGATFLTKGQATNYTEAQGLPVSSVRAFARDGTGTIWAAVVGGLARLEGQRWHSVHMDWNYPAKSAWSLFTDRQGNLWVSTGSGVVVLRNGTRKFQDTGIQCGIAYGFAEAADGSILFDDEHSKLFHVVRLGSTGQVGRLPDIHVPAGSPMIDRDDGLWIPTNEGVARIPSLGLLQQGQPSFELFTKKQGLTGNIVTQVLQDEEGNIWVSTANGLDRFRHRNVTWFQLPGVNLNLVEDRNGEIWAGSNRKWQYSLLNVQDGRDAGAKPAIVYTVFRDRDGSIWYSTPNALTHWKDGRFVEVPPPAAVAKFSLSTSPRSPIIASSITRDSYGRLWVAYGGSGEFRLENGTWNFVPILPGHADWAANYAFADDLGHVWLCWGDRVAEVDHGLVHVYGREQGLTVGPYEVVAGMNQDIWIGGESGVAILESGHFHTVESADGNDFRSITGIVVTRLDGVWLSSAVGVIHIPQSEENILHDHPSHKVSFDLFDTTSDLPEPLQSNAIWSSGAIESSNGNLWVASSHGAVRIDPANIYRNPLPPPVSVSSILADDRIYSHFSTPRLPPLTQNVVIRYDALSLAIPERVRFRYKLESWDRDWHVTGARREAYFTHLAPGRYVFHVIACNNDGVWNNKGASLTFFVLPAWYQTYWFLALCCVGGLTVLWMLYRLRLRQIAKTISARFDERLAERIQIAHDLHDTVLQTIQGSKMVADQALDQCSDPGTRHTLEKLSGWLDRAIHESRAALNSLRLSTIVRNDLAEALRRACENKGIAESMSVAFSVVGDPREMHPIVRDEVFRLAYEAIRNAQAHSHATSLVVEVRYSQDLTVLVQDNGVGIDPSIADHGKEGHFGLQGMRERAARIRGKLTISSSLSMGTKVLLTVPGVVSFSNEKPGILARGRLFFMRLIGR